MNRIASIFLGALLVAVPACQKGKDTKDKSKTDTASTTPGAGSAAPGQAEVKRGVESVPPPMPVEAPPADAKKTESGISYVFLSESQGGESPGRNDTIQVHYTGWKTDGSTFYSTRKRGKPQPMSLAQTAPGWTEAIGMMTVGQKAMFWIPPELAFKGKPAAPAQTLVFEVELVSFEKAPPVPEDLTAAPSDATTTKSGLAYKLLEKGTGKEKPGVYDTVTLEYTGWRVDGMMIDSTEVMKRSRQAMLFREMPGFVEGIQTMVAGERKRFWIPAALAKEIPGMEPSAVVYDIKLVDMKKNPPPPPTPKDVAAPPADAQKTDKGVSYKVLKKGKGTENPTATAKVKVNYTGWTTDGKMFDSSVIRGEPAEFPLNGVIPGWTDGLQKMVVGDSMRFWIPEELAYKGNPGRPQGMLVFDVDLLEIVAAPPPGAAAPGDLPAPADVAAPPADAKKSPKGVFYKVQKPGKAGGAKPGPTSTVKVHYSGWTTDGKMFDSSVKRGQPIEFPLTGVIPGWTDGLQMMTVGETTRLWIPEELAYKGQPGRPQGMLVFDVELIEIK